MRIHAQVKQIIRSLPILWMLGGGTAGGVGGALRAMATENREKRRMYFMVLNVVLDLGLVSELPIGGFRIFAL